MNTLQTLKDTFNFFYKFKFSKNRIDIFNLMSSFEICFVKMK